MTNRIAFLDGLRGVAILMVVFFHSYARWPDVVPYGDQYKYFFGIGRFGVELFFMISGFVILMTLEKCSNFKEFIFRRWLRLFPAMLFCSIIIFVTAGFFNERPAGQPSLAGLLPGLFFVEPSWIKFITGEPINPLEEAFWSLYVEFKFYVIAGFVYFLFGRNKLLWTLIALSGIGLFFHWIGANSSLPSAQLLSKLVGTMSFNYFGWFVSGALAYLYLQTKNTKWLIYACFSAICCSIFFDFSNTKATIGALLVSGLFVFSLVSKEAKFILSMRLFQFFGFISYPLYLSHENAMVASIVKLGNIWSTAPQYIYPLIPIAGLSLFSYFCAKHAEPITRKSINTIISLTGFQLKTRNSTQ